ncbi:hypothetical protein BC832DRAFT_549326 [Gaertneriomyces semiglobifer]|nr:hypothetical protein BC832DRAFT_549326 [Gaertneriomyces semiglobifer]
MATVEASSASAAGAANDAPVKNDGKKKNANRQGTQAALLDAPSHALRDKGRRLVFRHVFDSPFNFQWPSLTAEDSADVLRMLCDIFAPVCEYRKAQAAQRKKAILDKVIVRKKEQAAKRVADEQSQAQSATIPVTLDEIEAAQKKKKKKRKVEMNVVDALDGGCPAVLNAAATANTHSVDADPPLRVGLEPLGDIVVGVNAVTKCLEQNSEPTAEQSSRSPARLRLVFVCNQDVPATHLFTHIPAMVQLAGERVLLCPLAKGAEDQISSSLGLKRVSILGIKTDTPRFDALYQLLAEKLPRWNIPWIATGNRIDEDSVASMTTGSSNAGTYRELNIVAVKTFAPLGGKNDRGGRGGRGKRR